MNLRNPCGRCLVRPTCRDICEDMKVYNELSNMIFILLITFISCILTFTLIIFIFQRYGIIPASIITGVLVLVGYGTSFTVIIKDWEECKKAAFHEKFLIGVFGPWLFVGGGVYSLFDDEIDLFIFRYNRKIMNSYLQKLWIEKCKKRKVMHVRISWSIWPSKGDD